MKKGTLIMEELFLAGRLLTGGFYLFSAFHHFSDLDSLARSAAAHIITDYMIASARTCCHACGSVGANSSAV